MARSSALRRFTERVSASLRRSSPGAGADRSSVAEGDDFVAVYAPRRNGAPDPGEVVWAWVPYEDDPSQGKDRPVLVLGHDTRRLVGVPLSSKDHGDRPDAHEWVEVGRGAWDGRSRVSYADASRLLRLDPSSVRREGSALRRRQFNKVLARVRELQARSS